MTQPQQLQQIIEEATKHMPFGTVHITLKQAHSSTVTVDLSKVTSRKVDGNAQALTMVGTMLKMIGQAGDTGNLTFTITVDKGTAKNVMVNDFDRKTLGSDGSYRG